MRMGCVQHKCMPCTWDAGVPPFWGETEQQIFQSILKGKLDFESDPWPALSQEAKDCVAIMLNMDPKKRATAEEVLRHPWMKENGVASDKPLDNVILSRMRNFSNMNKLKREALKFIATKLSPDEIEGLKQIFKVSMGRGGVEGDGALQATQHCYTTDPGYRW